MKKTTREIKELELAVKFYHNQITWDEYCGMLAQVSA